MYPSFALDPDKHRRNIAQTNLKKQTLGQLLEKDLGPRNHLLKPWLREQDSAMIWAAPGVGKTMFTLTLALTIAGGGRFLGWHAEQPAKVLLIDGEMPEHDLQDRLRMLAPTVLEHDPEAASENLEIIARHAQSPDEDFLDLGDPMWGDELLNRLQRKNQPDVVIFDNLSTLAQLDDENSTAATVPVVRLLSRLKQAKIACIVVHHSNKSGSHFRGASNLATSFEVILGLIQRGDVLDPDGGAKFNIDWTKYRGKRDSTTVPMGVALEDCEDGSLSWTSSCPEGALFDAIERLLKTGECQTQADLLDKLPEYLRAGESKQWMSKKMRQFRAEGRMSESEIRRCFDAARDDSEDEENTDF